MVFRIGDFVIRGEIDNSKRNSINGWFEFGDDEGIRFNLAGNLRGELAGKHIQFESAEKTPDELTARDPTGEIYKQVDKLEVMQIGVVGTVEYRMVRTIEGPIEEFLTRCKLGERPPTPEKPSLYFEWFSQNGNLQVEVVLQSIAFVPPKTAEDIAKTDPTPRPLPDANDNDGESGPGLSGFSMNEFGEVEELSFDGREEEEPDDKYKLFPADLESQLQDESFEDPIPYDDAPDTGEQPRGKRPWDEVIPGIDPETKKMYEEWDEVIYGEKDEPLATLFDPPIALKKPSEIADEAEAESLLTILLARLALCCVSVRICEHYTALETYRWLMEEIVPNENVHPRLLPTGFIRGYSTGEHCAVCEANFDAEYNARYPKEPNEGE